MNWGIAGGQDSGSSYDIPGYTVISIVTPWNYMKDIGTEYFGFHSNQPGSFNESKVTFKQKWNVGKLQATGCIQRDSLSWLGGFSQLT